jgi:hypothetical protein
MKGELKIPHTRPGSQLGSPNSSTAPDSLHARVYKKSCFLSEDSIPTDKAFRSSVPRN